MFSTRVTCAFSDSLLGLSLLVLPLLQETLDPRRCQHPASKTLRLLRYFRSQYMAERTEVICLLLLFFHLLCHEHKE